MKTLFNSFDQLEEAVKNKKIKISASLRISVYTVIESVEKYTPIYEEWKKQVDDLNKACSEYHTIINPTTTFFGDVDEKSIRFDKMSKLHYLTSETKRKVDRETWHIERALQEILDNQEFFNFELAHFGIMTLAQEYELNIFNFRYREYK